MANELARLIVKLEAQTGAYDVSLKKATRELNKFRNETGSTLGKIQKQFSAFGSNLLKTFALGSITAGVYGLTRALGGAIKAGDDLAKFASKTGLSAEAASELAHAAKMADLDLTKLETGIKKMQVTLSQAGSGMKTAETTLNALGLSFEKLKDLKPDQQFELIAEQISKLKDPADRTRAAVELFGKAGADLLPLFEHGAEGIRKAREEAQKLGKSFTAADLKALQEADDAIKRLSASVGALTDRIAILASGPLSVIADGLRSAVGGKGTDLENINTEIAKMLKLGIFTDAAAKKVEKLIQLRESLIRLEQSSSKRGRGATGGNDPSGFGTSEEFDKQIDALKKQVAMHGQVGRAAEMRYELEFGALKNLEDPQKQQLLAYAMQLDSLDKQVQAVKDLEEEYKVLGNTLENVLSIDASRLNAPLMQGDITRDVLPGLESLSDKVQSIDGVELPEMGEAFKTTTDAMSVYADEAARNMQDVFADFLFDPFDNGLKGMLKGFVDILRRMLAEAMSAKIFEAIGGTGVVSDFLGGLFSAGSGSVSSVATAYTTVPGMAGGGHISRGGAAIVGEKGPELFIPGAAGNVIPNGGIGGPAITYNIDARGATTDLVQALPAIMQENNRRLMEALRDARSRGQF